MILKFADNLFANFSCIESKYIKMADRPLFIRLNLPSGLEEALESLAREVLRQKPTNIYEFAADHFEELVKRRNECK